MEDRSNHVGICVCTYKRPESLNRLLEALTKLETRGFFSCSIVVVDNDVHRSAEPIVRAFGAASPVPIRYYVEPRQNISLARNAAINNARGDFLAFIDDDELPTTRWLLTLFEAMALHKADGVLGPVKPLFPEHAPRWVVRGNFYDHPARFTGTPVCWKEGRTGNVLLRKSALSSARPYFRPEFRGGEDTDFFRRMTSQGRLFIWSEEAIVYEIEPPIRWKRSYMLRKALLRGAVTLLHPTFGARDIAKSLVAVPVYLAALPFLLFCGHHRFMDLLIRLFDHLGKLLAVVGINPIKSHYVEE